MPTNTKIVLALDEITLSEVVRFEHQNLFKDKVDVFKVSLPFLFEGLVSDSDLLKQFLWRNRIFFDFKLHDIPFQVSKSLKSLLAFNPELVTIHAIAGRNAMRLCKEIKDFDDGNTKVVGVTVLTSETEATWAEHHNRTIKNSVSVLTDEAMSLGLDGVVCDGDSAKMVKYRYPQCVTVVPGFRFDDEVNDQKRVTTPATLNKEYVDYLVVERAVTGAETVEEMVERLERIRELIR